MTERAIVKQNIDDVLIQRPTSYNILVDTISITNFHFSLQQQRLAQWQWAGAATLMAGALPTGTLV